MLKDCVGGKKISLYRLGYSFKTVLTTSSKGELNLFQNYGLRTLDFYKSAEDTLVGREATRLEENNDEDSLEMDSFEKRLLCCSLSAAGLPFPRPFWPLPPRRAIIHTAYTQNVRGEGTSSEKTGPFLIERASLPRNIGRGPEKAHGGE